MANRIMASFFLYKLIWKQCRSKTYISSMINTKKFYIFSLQGVAGLGFLWSKSSTTNEDKEKMFSVIETADREFDDGHYEDCYHTLIKSKFFDNVDIKWRICRVLYNMAKDLKYDQNYRKDLIEQAYEVISQELPNSMNSYAIHKWYALILEAKTNYEGYKEKIKQLENIKKHLDLAVTLNPNDAATLHMLGEWCYQLSEMSWYQRKIAELLFTTLPTSSYEDALEYYLKAETVQPRFYSINLLRLGSCYLKMNKEDQAKYYLQLAASYPAKSNEDHQANKEATDLLKHLK